MRKYLDIETDKIITEDQLRDEFETLRKANETDAENFGQYLNNCLDKNGTLEKIADEVWIKRLQRDVARDIACAEMPYEKCLDVLQKKNVFGNWTAYEINHRPVDVDAIIEMVEQELGLWG